MPCVTSCMFASIFQNVQVQDFQFLFLFSHCARFSYIIFKLDPYPFTLRNEPIPILCAVKIKSFLEKQGFESSIFVSKALPRVYLFKRAEIFKPWWGKQHLSPTKPVLLEIWGRGGPFEMEGVKGEMHYRKEEDEGHLDGGGAAARGTTEAAFQTLTGGLMDLRWPNKHRAEHTPKCTWAKQSRTSRTEVI